MSLRCRMKGRSISSHALPWHPCPEWCAACPRCLRSRRWRTSSPPSRAACPRCLHEPACVANRPFHQLSCIAVAPLPRVVRSVPEMFAFPPLEDVFTTIARRCGQGLSQGIACIANHSISCPDLHQFRTQVESQEGARGRRAGACLVVHGHMHTVALTSHCIASAFASQRAVSSRSPPPATCAVHATGLPTSCAATGERTKVRLIS